MSKFNKQLSLITDHRRSTTGTSSNSSKISAHAMSAILERLKCQKNRQSTMVNYHNIWRLFNKFVIQLDIKPNNWEDRIALYGAYLVDTGHQSSTIKSYFSAIKSVLQDDGYAVDVDKVILNTLIRACRLVNDKVQTRLPIHLRLLEMLMFELEHKFATQPYLTCLYQTIFMLAYYGMFRIGELTLGSHTIKAKDIHIGENKNKILIILYSSKTHGKESVPQRVKISSSKRENIVNVQKFFCPFKKSREYLAIRGNYESDTDPFFIFQGNIPVEPFHVRKTLKETLSALNLNPKMYKFHGFRAGRATDMAKFNVPLLKIRSAGRWRSNAVFKYIKSF